MKLHLIIKYDSFEISDYNRARLRQAVKDNGRPIRAYIETITPESRSQRKYVMGGLIPLLVYLDGGDYRDTETKEHYFEFLKKELCPTVLTIKGKSEVFGKSTKGSEALGEFCEKLQDYLHEQYGIAYDNKAMNPEEYKKFRDEIYPTELGYEDFVDYCVKMKFLTIK